MSVRGAIKNREAGATPQCRQADRGTWSRIRDDPIIRGIYRLLPASKLMKPQGAKGDVCLKGPEIKPQKIETGLTEKKQEGSEFGPLDAFAV